MQASDHFRRRRFDCVRDFSIQPMLAVHPSRRLLHQGKRMDDSDGHAFMRREGEIADAALCLCAPIGLGRDLDRAETVAFGAGFPRHFFRPKSTVTTLEPSSASM